jgi:ABC-type dipeptide/oligopeptide/nickel transport system ATPase component
MPNRVSCTASTFEVARGEVVTLIGRNGAGKTTTLRAIMGLLQKSHRRRSASATRDHRRGACRNTRSRVSGHRLLPGGARHLRLALTVEGEPLPAAGACAEGGMPLDEALYALTFPNLKAERRSSQGHRSSPAASSRCWPSPASCAPVRDPAPPRRADARASRRSSCKQIGAVIRQAQGARFHRSSSSSRIVRFARPGSPTAMYVVEHGTVDRHADGNAERRRRHRAASRSYLKV